MQRLMSLWKLNINSVEITLLIDQIVASSDHEMDYYVYMFH